jgi:hypothetical protein
MRALLVGRTPNMGAKLRFFSKIPMKKSENPFFGRDI